MKPSSAAQDQLPGSKFTYYIYKGGNSTETVKRACDKLGWTQTKLEDPGAPVSVNFVWKPEWQSKYSYEPPTGWSRENKNPLKRQVWNHFRAVEPLCQKDSLVATMNPYFQAIGIDADASPMPVTFLIEPVNKSDPSGGQAEWPGWSAFTAKFRQCAADPSLKNLWLCKPTANNRGIGIEVLDTLEGIRTFLESKARSAAHGVNTTWVVQKYLERPLLFRGRKFDLRVWVLLLDNGEVYVHAPGYVRTSSNAFTLDSTERYIHLTNFCQQVNNESFSAFEEGNTLTWDQLVQYLDQEVMPGRAKEGPGPGAGVGATSSSSSGSREGEEGDPPVAAARTAADVIWGCGSNGVWGQIRSIIRHTFEALRGRGGSRTQGWEENGFARRPPQGVTLPVRRRAAGESGDSDAASSCINTTGSGGGATPSAGVGAGAGVGTGTGAGASFGAPTTIGGGGAPGSRHRFELLGYDFMIDADFRVHFIEVNTNPSLTYQAGWHEEFVDSMMERTLGLIAASTWPDVFGDKKPPASEASLDGSRPADGWQHIFNVYTAPLRHAGQAGPAAALAMAGLSRSAGNTPGRPGGKENGNAPASPTKLAAARTLQGAASKLLSPGRGGAGGGGGARSAWGGAPQPAPLPIAKMTEAKAVSEEPADATEAEVAPEPVAPRRSMSVGRLSATVSSTLSSTSSTTASTASSGAGAGAGAGAAGSGPPPGHPGSVVPAGPPAGHPGSVVRAASRGRPPASSLRLAAGKQVPRNRVAAVVRAVSVGTALSGRGAGGQQDGGGSGEGMSFMPVAPAAPRSSSRARSKSPAVHFSSSTAGGGMGGAMGQGMGSGLGISGTALISPPAG